jgi:hypothetical protein
MSKKIIIAVIAILLIVFTHWYFSPYLALHNIKKAINNKNPQQMQRYINRDSLKESIKKQLLTEMQQDTDLNTKEIALTTQMIDKVASDSVSDNHIAENIRNGNYNINNMILTRNGFNEVLISSTNAEATIVLTRFGYSSWKISEFRFQ